MKKLLSIISILSLTLLTACATNTSSQKGLKKSPCACNYIPLPSADGQVTDPYALKNTASLSTGVNPV